MASGSASSELPRRLFTAAETARMLGIGESTVHDLRKAGDLGSVKIGSSRRFSIEAIDAFVPRRAEAGD
jgi:excisionase family DNA binding protein